MAGYAPTAELKYIVSTTSPPRVPDTRPHFPDITSSRSRSRVPTIPISHVPTLPTSPNTRPRVPVPFIATALCF